MRRPFYFYPKNVRFGSQANVCGAKRHVCLYFESGQRTLCRPIADMASTTYPSSRRDEKYPRIYSCMSGFSEFQRQQPFVSSAISL